MKLTMDNKVNGALPYMVAVVFVTQVITLMAVLRVPLDRQEFLCNGIFTSPNNIRCYEQ